MPTLNVEPQDFGRKTHERREAFRSARAINNLDGTVTTLVTDLEDLIDLINYASGTYTPTLVGMAVGTGGSATNTASYTHVAGILVVEGVVRFGTTGTTFPAATITASLPPGFTQGANANKIVGRCYMTLAAAGNVEATVTAASSSTVRFVVSAASGSYVSATATSTTVPGTWAAGDRIDYQYTTRVETLASFLLLEGGDDILLEDGTSKIELE